MCKFGSIPNSIIISGPKHTGKTTLALDISKAINCIKEQKTSAEENECECDQCKRINSNNHPDVLIVNRESICSNVSKKESCKYCGPTMGQTVIPICVIRDLVLGRSQTKPFYGIYQVTILEDAHLLRKESLDHLLKVSDHGILDLEVINITW